MVREKRTSALNDGDTRLRWHMTTLRAEPVPFLLLPRLAPVPSGSTTNPLPEVVRVLLHPPTLSFPVTIDAVVRALALVHIQHSSGAGLTSCPFKLGD